MRPLLFVLLLLAAPARAEVAVSILPLQAWASELLGEEVDVLVGPGQSPALFEPSARQLASLSGADLLFAIGVPFERVLLPRLRRMFPGLAVVELGEGIERMPWPELSGHGTTHDTDPHVWLDARHAARLVREMSGVLIARYPDRSAGIEERAAGLCARFEALDTRLRERLAPLRGQDVLAYHPALGYFAAAYGLGQVAVESGGTEPGARHLAEIAARIGAQSLRVLVVEPQFAPHRARSLAGSMGLEVLVLDPLSTDLVAELDRFANALVAAARPGEHP